MAMTILTGNHSPALTVPVMAEPGATLIGHVGRSPSDQGVQVRLNILDKDQRNFEVYTEIAVTNPARLDRGIVRVGDDGLICWHGTMRIPGRPEDGINLDDISGTLGRTLTATFCAR